MRLPLLPHRVVFALTGAFLLAACSGGGKKASAPTTAVPVPSTEAPAPAGTGDVAPLTGLPEADPVRRARVALVVKIDNAPKGRPQAGINQADVVYEQKVEGGIPRLAAIFQSADADPVGPVRSARSTDIAIVAPLNRPLFAYAGTNAVFQQQVTAAPLIPLSPDTAGDAYRRVRDRPAPYNLYSSTPALFRRAAPGAGPPSALFPYRPTGQPLEAPGAEPARGVRVEYRDKVLTTVEYEWDGSAFLRAQNGTPHVDAAGERVGPVNVVIQFVSYRDTGLVDASRTAVPEAELVGEGEAWVLTDGKIVRGRWSKPEPSAVTRYTDAAGAAVPLTPGRTWVELADPGAAAVTG